MLISIVMPTLNEVVNLPARAAEIERQRGPWEWIVADGGSTDATRDVARRLGAEVIVAPRGRGRQLDAGAAQARGAVLLFLHADTSLPAGACEAVRAAARQAVGGNFALRFDERSPTVRFFEAFYRVQQSIFGVYYGDSAIFVRADAYRRIGGFGTQPIMEDYAFVRRLERCGRTRRLRLAVTTSSRRFRGRPLRMVCRWIAIVVLYRLGIPPTRLARLYRPHAPS